ncbi:hypothetical protein B0J18DRAFT_218059 [Chaetomium sp. MPI-SDFR-AT-0129]|nr:hypothetical protein B0J18DRAFT_218059 [Chaetomium sp. MPI-SDFR-AT-0129]
MPYQKEIVDLSLFFSPNDFLDRRQSTYLVLVVVDNRDFTFDLKQNIAAELPDDDNNKYEVAHAERDTLKNIALSQPLVLNAIPVPPDWVILVKDREVLEQVPWDSPIGQDGGNLGPVQQVAQRLKAGGVEKMMSQRLTLPFCRPSWPISLNGRASVTGNVVEGEPMLETPHPVPRSIWKRTSGPRYTICVGEVQRWASLAWKCRGHVHVHPSVLGREP